MFFRGRVRGYIWHVGSNETNIGKSLLLPVRKINERSQARPHQHTNTNALQKSKKKIRVLGAELTQMHKQNSNVYASLGQVFPRKTNSEGAKTICSAFFCFFFRFP